MEIEHVEPAQLDRPLATALASVEAAALEDVPVPGPTGESFWLDARHSEEPDQTLWVARESGVVVGWARLVETRHEYRDSAFLAGVVTPRHQGCGIGRALLTAVGRHTGRTHLRARAWRGTAGAHALPALGFRRVLTSEVRRLELGQTIPDEDALRAEVASAAAAYDLERYVGPTPGDLLEPCKSLREAINDSPDALEWEAYPPDRVRAHEQSLAARRQTQHTIVARDRRTARPAGLTIVCVPELAPAIAAQEDTTVLRAHRGRRLGLRLKLDMVDWLRAARSDVRAVDTWNDTANAPVLALNLRLGARYVAASSAYTRPR